MTRCGNCGAQGSGRFCSQCGVAISSAHSSTPRIFGAEHEEDATASESVHTGSGRRRLFVLLALVGVMMIGISVFTQSDDEPLPNALEDALQGEDGDQVRSQATTTTSAVPRTTSAPGDTSQLNPPEVGDPSGFWLGEEAGWYALVSTTDGLLRIDLDTGELTAMNSELSPLVNTGEYVVLQDRFGGLYAMEVAAATQPLTEEPSPISDIQYTSALLASVSSDPSRVWLSETYGIGEVFEIDLVSGEELTHRGRSAGEPDFWFGPGATTGRFTSPIGGGIYEMQTDGTFLLRGDGFVQAEGYGRMLVSSCDVLMTCSSRWVDTETLETRPDLFVPVGRYYGSAFLMGQGRVIDGGQGALFDIETGEDLRLGGRELEGLYDGRSAVTPDARFIVSVHGSRQAVRSFATGRAQDLPPVVAHSGAKIVFVPKPATDSPEVR